MRTDLELIADLTALIGRLDARIDELEHTWQMRRCDDCDATWEAQPGDPCPWCTEAQIRQHDEQRAILLTPPVEEQGPRYDELTDIDKQVWDRTRGNTGEGSMIAWAERLGRAVDAGTITKQEAEHARQRAKKTLAA